MDRNGQQPSQPSLVTQYADAAQTCRDIAAQVGVRHCDDDPTWRATEQQANSLHTQALAAGHSYDELSAADKARKTQS